MKQKVILRSDGNSDIGLGHIYRCIALAEMLKPYYDCVFATRFLSCHLEIELKKVCRDIIQLPETDSHFEHFLSILKGDEIVVLDNYFYHTSYQQAIKETGCRLVCIDDNADRYFVADAIINHAGGFDKRAYSTTPYTCLYIGPHYALLRPPFLSSKNTITGDSVFICMGGADKNNVTLQVLEILAQKKCTHTCLVVIGDAYQHPQALEEFKKTSGLTIHILKNLSAEAMAGVMSGCRYAICPPSTVSYEYLSGRGGEIYLKQTADNQKDLYSFYIQNDIAYDISELFVTDVARLQRSLNNQKKYFDGNSARRLLTLFQHLEEERTLRLRKADRPDMDLYFKWANDPEARENAISTSSIPYDTHVSWFTQRINSENAYLWVLEKKNTPVGQIRFDIDRDTKEATISYSIDRVYRGKGLGLSIVKMGLEFFSHAEKEIMVIHAIVKESNMGSRKIFEHFLFQKELYTAGFIDYQLSVHNCFK